MEASFNVSVNPRIVQLRSLLDLTATDMKQMARQVDIQFAKNERHLFTTEGASGGRRWPGLSAQYEKRKRKVRPGRKLMVFDGKLRRSLISRTDSMHAMHWGLKPTPFISVGTKDIKAAWHGPPNSLRNPNLPQRDVLQHTSLQERGYYDIIRHHFNKVKMPRYFRALKAWRKRRV